MEMRESPARTSERTYCPPGWVGRLSLSGGGKANDESITNQ